MVLENSQTGALCVSEINNFISDHKEMNLSLNDCFMKIQCKTIIDDNFQKIYKISKQLGVSMNLREFARIYTSRIWAHKRRIEIIINEITQMNSRDNRVL